MHYVVTCLSRTLGHADHNENERNGTCPEELVFRFVQVLSGITLTKVVGIFVLAFAKSQIFEVSYTWICPDFVCGRRVLLCVARLD